MAAIAEAVQSGRLPAELVLVLSDRPDAPLLKEAEARGIPASYLEPGPFQSKLSDNAEHDYIETLRTHRVDWVVLAGFMRIIKSAFLRAFPERIVNIHPSLLPSFPGLNAPRQALQYGVQVTGSTVHLVDQGIDTGAIVAQAPVAVKPNDTPEHLHQRIKAIEHELYPQALADLVTGTLRIEGRQVTRTSTPTPGSPDPEHHE